MASKKNDPLRVTTSARAAEGAGTPFVARDGFWSDVGVALDEIGSLTDNVEPVVLRVSASGGHRLERDAVAGDWLCSDHLPPSRVPPASWSFDQGAMDWSRDMTWLDAWEGCGDPVWLMKAAASVGVDRRPMALAACDCAGLAMRFVAAGETRPRRALLAARRWALEGRPEALVRETAAAAMAAANELLDAGAGGSDAAPQAAMSAYYAARSVSAPARSTAATLAVSAARIAGVPDKRACSVIRRRIGTVAVLVLAARGPGRAA